MKPTPWTRGALSALALAATACGVEPTQSSSPPQLVEDLAAAPHTLRLAAANPNQAACDAIDARLRDHREELAATPEWHDMVETPQWSLLTDAVKRAVDANCEFVTADDACATLMQQVHKAFGDLRATPAYSTAEATPEWQTLKDDYADAKDNACWEQWHDSDADSSAKYLDPNGPINPSPNPAPNPTPVPPTNPDTGNTEPNGGEPNTQPEPQGGPINPSPNPAPNPTPVPPTNPDTGNTEGG